METLMEEGPLKRFLRMAAPILMLIGVEVLLAFAFAMIFRAKVMKEAGITDTAAPGAYQALLDKYVELIRDNSLLITLIVGVIAIAFSLLLLKNDEKRHRYNVVYKSIPLPAYPAAAVLGTVLCAGINLFFYVSGFYGMMGSDAAAMESVYRGSIIIQIVTVCIVSPLMEELVFRNLFYKRMRDYISFWPACLVSAFVFAVYHGNLLQGTYAFITGIVLAFIFEKTDFVLIPFLCHAAANTLSYVLTYTLKEMPGETVTWVCLAVCTAAAAGLIFYFYRKVQVEYSLKKTV
ncbi:MAG: CPBP family intramembrane metalloprotease [Lachnospiraceae bacterium]|nr:CPBP family intramembrane metalloprotease [Lachnospiraceae bacterium]